MYTSDGLKVELVMVTPQMARHLRDTCNYERQRTISEPHVKYLLGECRRGRFLRGTQAHFCVLDGRPFIVNGNHTLEMIADGDAAVPMVFLYEVVRNEEEMGRIYARHDSHRPRDWAAKLKATGQDDAFGVAKKWLNAIAAAAPLLANGLHLPQHGTAAYHERRSADSRVDAMTAWRDELAQYASLCSESHNYSRAVMRRSILVACGAYVLRYQPSAAAEFISGMAADDGLSQNDPRKRMLEWLRSNPSGGKSPAVVETERRFRSAWNAFFDNRSIAALVAAADATPLRGTPLNAKKRDAGSTSSIKTGVRPRPDGTLEPVSFVDP